MYSPASSRTLIPPRPASRFTALRDPAPAPQKNQIVPLPPRPAKMFLRDPAGCGIPRPAQGSSPYECMKSQTITSKVCLLCMATGPAGWRVTGSAGMKQTKSTRCPPQSDYCSCRCKLLGRGLCLKQKEHSTVDL